MGKQQADRKRKLLQMSAAFFVYACLQPALFIDGQKKGERIGQEVWPVMANFIRIFTQKFVSDAGGKERRKSSREMYI